ncbi:hypothetical protein [Rhodococcus aetherivorans]|uniref:hypothetical protein n=1 Tax=Rhodococcus aetherivorans TaxID=191292 RepID=UPI000622CB08|nr:hypothetical protein [Rhodococcus aetherivorans]AKE92495.1 hypothetical protein AAT18_10685 [Rhodococcus aetherivorans]
MSNLIPRSARPLTTYGASDSFTRSEGRELMRRQNAEIARGIVSATRLQAAGMVATVGMQATAMLYRQADLLSGGDPELRMQLNPIAGQYASCVGVELARFSLSG